METCGPSSHPTATVLPHPKGPPFHQEKVGTGAPRPHCASKGLATGPSSHGLVTRRGHRAGETSAMGGNFAGRSGHKPLPEQVTVGSQAQAQDFSREGFTQPRPVCVSRPGEPTPSTASLPCNLILASPPASLSFSLDSQRVKASASHHSPQRLRSCFLVTVVGWGQMNS